jgi:hypothetical protein
VGVGVGVGVEVAAADWPGDVETFGETEEPTGVAVGPDASEAWAVALGEAVLAATMGLALLVEDP